MNPIYIHLSISTTKKTIKLTAICVLSGNIVSISTRNNMQRSIKSFIKTEANKFAQLWAREVHDY